MGILIISIAVGVMAYILIKSLSNSRKEKETPVAKNGYRHTREVFIAKGNRPSRSHDVADYSNKRKDENDYRSRPVDDTPYLGFSNSDDSPTYNHSHTHESNDYGGGGSFGGGGSSDSYDSSTSDSSSYDSGSSDSGSSGSSD